jgi:hypothetical protein
MVRFADLAKSLPAIAIALFSATALAASDIPLLDGSVTAKEWESLPQDPRLAYCDSAGCTVLRALVKSFVELDRRDLPNSMARPEPARAVAEPVSIVRLIRAAPSEDAVKEGGNAACGMLSVLARSYFDWSVGLHTIEIASLLEPFRSSCVPEVVTAFPAGDETRSLLANAAEFCEVREERACEAIKPRPR